MNNTPVNHMKILAVVFVALGTILSVLGAPSDGRSHQFNFRCFPQIDQNAKYPRFASSNRDPISLQVTPRVTHQLMSRIFAIFLREVLFYENVNIIESQKFPEEIEHHRLFLGLLPLSSRVMWPEATVDLEVWMPPDYHVIPDQVRDAGAVTSSGRFGWFIPKKFLSEHQQITFRDFQSDVPSSFSSLTLADGTLEDILPQAEKFCNFNGTLLSKCFYTPAHCIRKECSLMLAPDFYSTGFVIHHIEEFKLNIQVLFLGGNLTNILTRLQNQGASRYLVLHWSPSDEIDGNTEKYEAVLMPKCEEMKSSSVTGCKYELTPLLKFYAQQLHYADYATVALNKFYFPHWVLRDLLQNYTEHVQMISSKERIRSEIFNDVACSWMKNNEEIFHRWIPVREPKEDIYIGGIFPITNTQSIHKCLPDASRLAADDVNAIQDILPNHRLVVQRQDGQCRTDAVMKAFINYYMRWEKVIGILGPACSETVEPIAGVSKHFRMSVISYAAEGVSFTDRTTYPYFFRTIGHNHQFQEVFLNIFRHMMWQRVAAITVDGQKYTGYISHMETMLKANHIELAFNKKLSQDPSPSSVHQMLLDLKSTTRIFIADVDDDVAKILLCEAFKLHMTAKNGYVWFLPVWLEKQQIHNNTTDCTVKDLREAFNGHFSLSYAPYGQDDQIITTLNTSVSEWQGKFQNVCTTETTYSYTGYTYDAVWVYAYALDRLIK
uniref:Putative venus kinase receptor n=1 Tax=Nyssomyia neivai TaxID=330878 RepID=A0A1L8DJ23_9DIPT